MKVKKIMKPHKFIIILSLLLLPACANWSSIHRSHDFNKGSSSIIDAKQRAIISVKRSKIKNGSEKIKHVVCAEPSPDALTALAATGALEGGNGKIGGRLAGAFKESAGSIGLRTQTIQMLRDDKYRLCEAYANGAIDKVEYRFLLRQAQKNMLALLATEQLTGAISAPAIILSGAGSSEVTRESIDNINSEIHKLEKENALLKSDNTEDAKIIKENNIKIEAHKETRKAFLDSIRNGSELNKITAMPHNPPLNMKNIAQSVECIVNTLNKKDDAISFCMMEYQRALRAKKDIDKTLSAVCQKVADNFLSSNNVADKSCGLSSIESASLSSSISNNPLGTAQ